MQSIKKHRSCRYNYMVYFIVVCMILSVINCDASSKCQVNNTNTTTTTTTISNNEGITRHLISKPRKYYKQAKSYTNKPSPLQKKPIRYKTITYNNNNNNNNNNPVSNSTSANKSFASTRHQQLYHILMRERQQRGLPLIPYSLNLQELGNIHAEMLSDMDVVNIRKQHQCNLHSWPIPPSSPNYAYNWTPCCYTSASEASCMHNKGKQLKLYNSNTFEIAYMGDYNPEKAIQAFIKSIDHRIVMFNEGPWSDKWEAVGIGCMDEFTVIWFGNMKDKDNSIQHSY